MSGKTSEKLLPLSKANHIVRYHNDLSDLVLKGFTVIENRLFMYICSECVDKGDRTVEISYEDIRYNTGYKPTSAKRMKDDLISMNDKLMDLRISVNNDPTKPDVITRFVLFPEFEVDPYAKVVRIEVKDKFLYLLNDITKDFTWFEFCEFCNLKSVYSQHCYRQLIRYRSTGCWNVSIEEFREVLDIPASYRMRDIDRSVLEPIQKELSATLDGFNMEKIKGSGRGNPVTRLKFTFTPSADRKAKKLSAKFEEDYEETSFVCPICKSPLIHKKINGSMCYCHKDGWMINAKCKMIFNSVADIEGYSERPTRSFETDPEYNELRFDQGMKKNNIETPSSNTVNSSFPSSVIDIISKGLNSNHEIEN